LSEKELVKGVIEKRRHCQETFFHRYAGIMMTVCRRYSRNNEEAEDLLQDSFIKVFKGLNGFNFHGSLEGWIKKIVVHTALKKYKKKSYSHELYFDKVDLTQQVEPTAIDKLNEEQLIRMIRALPKGYSLVFNLYVIEGYSHAEIADELNIKESTSRSQLAKARKLLQKNIIMIEQIAL